VPCSPPESWFDTPCKGLGQNTSIDMKILHLRWSVKGGQIRDVTGVLNRKAAHDENTRRGVLPGR
jgi:hypothetical protein